MDLYGIRGSGGGGGRFDDNQGQGQRSGGRFNQWNNNNNCEITQKEKNIHIFWLTNPDYMLF